MSFPRSVMKLSSRPLLNASNMKVIPRMNIHTTSFLRSDDEPYTDEGDYGLPFSTKNPYRFMIGAFIFLASGFWYPYWIYHHHRVRNLQAGGFLPKKE